MNSSARSRILSPTVLLYTFVIVIQIGRGAYLVSGGEPAPVFTFVNALGFLWIVSWWLLRDSRGRGIDLVYDIGMFLYIAWPLIISFYLLKTRGARGLLVILGFVVAFVGSRALGIALYELLTLSAR